MGTTWTEFETKGIFITGVLLPDLAVIFFFKTGVGQLFLDRYRLCFFLLNSFEISNLILGILNYLKEHVFLAVLARRSIHRETPTVLTFLLTIDDCFGVVGFN